MASDITLKLKPIAEQIMVITGASSGIGLATAREAAKQGAKVVLAARSEETLREIVSELNGGSDKQEVAIAVGADVSDRGQVESIGRAALLKFGRIDTWVNDAGVAIYGKIEEVPEEDSRRLFDVNFWGVVNGSLAALPHLRRNGGALINLGSEVSEAATPLLGMYVASKHAVKGFTDSLRIELQMENAPISVTLIQPTAVDTPFAQHARNYMGVEPALPDPKLDPKRVAVAILDAAHTPRRDVKVGAMAVVNTATAKLAGRVADSMAKRQSGGLQGAEPPRDPEGTLYRPGEGGATRGDPVKKK